MYAALPGGAIAAAIGSNNVATVGSPIHPNARDAIVIPNCLGLLTFNARRQSPRARDRWVADRAGNRLLRAHHQPEVRYCIPVDDKQRQVPKRPNSGSAQTYAVPEMRVV